VPLPYDHVCEWFLPRILLINIPVLVASYSFSGSETITGLEVVVVLLSLSLGISGPVFDSF